MTASKKMGSEAAATASKPLVVVLQKPTLVHSASAPGLASPPGQESESASIGEPFFECRKAGGCVLRAQFEAFKGTTYLDIRQWTERGAEFARTGKGATIPLDRVRELGEALCRVALPNSPEGAKRAS